MTVEQFLDNLGTSGLIAEASLAKLRAQVAKSSKPVSPKALAKHLVDSGALTLAQAQALLTAPVPEPDLDELELIPVDAVDGEDELTELVPLDDEPAQPKPAAASSQAKEASRKSSSAAQAVAASASSSLVEELVELDPVGTAGGGSPLDLMSAGVGFGGQGDAVLAPRKKRGLAGLFGSLGSGDPKKKKAGSQWESPLILFGGGALLLLSLIAVLLFFLYSRGSGDEMFRLAEDDYKSGSYTQAVDKYGQYLEKFPTHPSVSLAKVHLGLAKLRQATERANDFDRALEVANTVIKEIENEKEFSDARGDLRALFPDIAEGLVKEAAQQKDGEKVKAKLASAEKALNLATNPKYVPEAQRPMTRLAEIREKMAVVTRDINRDIDLASSVDVMKKSSAAGEIVAAFATRKKLLKAYPDLATNAALSAALLDVAKDEKSHVKIADSERPAVAKEAASSIIAQVAMAAQLAAPDSESSGPAAAVLVDGAVFCFDSGTGKLLWRRYVGLDSPTPPVLVDANNDADVLLIDAGRHELMRVALKSGQLVWRQPIGEPLVGVAVTNGGKHAIVATRLGKLIAVDVKTGNAIREATLPQPVRIAPTAHGSLPQIYEVAEQSTVYVLSANDLACQQAYYLGHETGSVRVPPTLLPKHLIVADNHGSRAATLHVLALDDAGQISKEVQRIEMAGNILTAPLVADRKLVAITDTGHIKIMGVNASSLDQPLTDLADQPAAEGDQPLVRHMFMDAGSLWIADKQLVRYKVQSAAGRLMPSPLDDNYENSTFDHPLVSLGGRLIHVRRASGVPGAMIVASDLETGRRIWETHVGAPPAGEPIAEGMKLAIVNSSSELFNLGSDNFKTGIANERPKTAAERDLPLLTSRVDLVSGRYVFAAAGAARMLVVQSGDEGLSGTWLSTADALACVPARLGKGLIAPTRVGQVFWLDPAKGKPVAAPFQPRISAGESVPWTTPDATADGKELIIADGKSHVYRIGVKREPAPHLEALATSEDLAEPIITPVAVLEAIAVAADANGKLHVFNLPDLKRGESVELGGTVVWGPRRLGEHIFVATANDELICCDGTAKIVWRQSLDQGPLAGTPAIANGELVIATLGGRVSRLALDSGKPIASAELGQPLASGPVPLGNRWVVATRGGALVVFNAPAGNAAAEAGGTE